MGQKGIARIQKTVSKTLLGIAEIILSASTTKDGIARIEKTVSQTLTGKAKILYPPVTPKIGKLHRDLLMDPVIVTILASRKEIYGTMTSNNPTLLMYKNYRVLYDTV